MTTERERAVLSQDHVAQAASASGIREGARAIIVRVCSPKRQRQTMASPVSLAGSGLYEDVSRKASGRAAAFAQRISIGSRIGSIAS